MRSLKETKRQFLRRLARIINRLLQTTITSILLIRIKDFRVRTAKTSDPCSSLAQTLTFSRSFKAFEVSSLIRETSRIAQEAQIKSPMKEKYMLSNLTQAFSSSLIKSRMKLRRRKRFTKGSVYIWKSRRSSARRPKSQRRSLKLIRICHKEELKCRH
jgi:hypothetical protein